jgi:hypothetical protein
MPNIMIDHLTVEDLESNLASWIVDGTITGWQASPVCDEDGQHIGLQVKLDIADPVSESDGEQTSSSYILTFVESETERMLIVRSADFALH